MNGSLGTFDLYIFLDIPNDSIFKRQIFFRAAMAHICWRLQGLSVSLALYEKLVNDDKAFF